MFTDLDTEEKKEERTKYIERLQEHINTVPEDQQSEHQKLITLLISQYGTSDIGILFACFFNILRLKTGESFVISPDEPHAYISGDLVECMVNSDNVIRGGLTPKLKDTKVLMELLKYEFKDRKQNAGVELINEGKTKMVEYKTGFAEFMVTKLEMLQSESEQVVSKTFNSLSIAIVLKGSATVEVEGYDSAAIEDKQCYFIMPGHKFTVRKPQGGEDLLVFFASCDI